MSAAAPARGTPAGDDIELATLASGVRVLTLPMPGLHTACVGLYLRSGSLHESERQAGIGHVVEHMVYKGTASRDARRINLDAERLGAQANAHTDKDHSAFQLRGLPAHAVDFVHQLAELLCTPSFPAAELEAERAVLLQELLETEDDPFTIAFELFDKACYGSQPAGRPVIGRRRNLERFGCDELARWLQQQRSGCNLVLAAAGPFGAAEVAALQRAAEAGFSGIGPGTANVPPAARWLGGSRARRLAGASQAHLVLGFPIAPWAAAEPTATVAAAVLGEGMSSPLLDEVRERRGLAYHAACSADVIDGAGQFVIEASTGASQLGELLSVATGLLRRQADGVADDDLQRARHQLAVRHARLCERPWQRLEGAVLDTFVHGAPRRPRQLLDEQLAVDAARLRAAFEAMCAAPAAVAACGQLGRTTAELLRNQVQAALR